MGRGDNIKLDLKRGGIGGCKLRLIVGIYGGLL